MPGNGPAVDGGGVGQLPAGAEDALGMLMEGQGPSPYGPGGCVLQAVLVTLAAILIPELKL